MSATQYDIGDMVFAAEDILNDGGMPGIDEEEGLIVLPAPGRGGALRSFGSRPEPRDHLVRFRNRRRRQPRQPGRLPARRLTQDPPQPLTFEPRAMTSIGIFGTDTGRTCLIAKQIAKKLGDVAAALNNIGRATLEEFLAHDALISAAPPTATASSPGESVGPPAGREEFMPQLAGVDLSGKVIALYGLGDQKKYPAVFQDAIGILHEALTDRAPGSSASGPRPATTSTPPARWRASTSSASPSTR